MLLIVADLKRFRGWCKEDIEWVAWVDSWRLDGKIWILVGVSILKIRFFFFKIVIVVCIYILWKLNVSLSKVNK